MISVVMLSYLAGTKSREAISRNGAERFTKLIDHPLNRCKR